jgi:transcriptional regulator with XRE-family HTH domain
MPIDVYTAAQTLGRCLREARLACGMTGKDVAEAADVSAATVTRLESGARGVSRPMLEFLVGLYKIDPDLAQKLELCRRLSRTVTPFDRFRKHVPETLIRFYCAQITALTLREFSVHRMPMLLRTDDHQEAMARFECDNADLSEWLELHRLARDLSGDVQTTFIIAEEALVRAVGGIQVAIDQLDALHDWGADPRIQIRVIPFDAGGMPTTMGFTLLTHDEPTDEVTAYASEVFTPAVQAGPEIVPILVATWARLQEVASKPEDLDRMLGQALTRLKENQRRPS